MEKFTKGNWQLHKKAYCCIVSSSGELIANAGQRERNFDFEALDIEQRSNAALIAAAPEMYEMLDNLRLVLTAANITPAAKGIEKLLAKARGEHDN